MTDSRFKFALLWEPRDDGSEYTLVIENQDGSTWNMPLTEAERNELLVAAASVPLKSQPTNFDGLGNDTTQVGRFGL